MIVWDAYPAAPAEPLSLSGEEYDPGDAPPGRVARLHFDAAGRVLVTMPSYPGVMRPPLCPATVWRPDGARIADLPRVAPTSTPTAVAVGPGGTWVAVGLSDFAHEVQTFAVRVWDPAAGRVLAERAVPDPVEDLRPLPGGGLLAACGGAVWRLPADPADPAERLSGPAGVVRVAVGDGRLAGASKSGAAVWDASGRHLADREHKKGPQNGPVAFRPGAGVMAVGHGTAVDLWDFVTGQVVVLKGHTRPVWAVGFSPDGGTCYTAASDGRVMAWDPDAGAVRWASDFGTGKLYAAAVAPDGLTLALGGDDGRVTVVDLPG